MASRYPVLFLVFVHFLCSASCSKEHHTLCLSCPPVDHPRDCKAFVEIGPHERCSTKRILLANGSMVYEFGHQSATNFIDSDSMIPEQIRQRRQMLIKDIALCHQGCTRTLCNRRLCGTPDSKSTGLACLVGTGVNGLPSDTSITYCKAGEHCYARRQNNARNQALTSSDFGCASQDLCGDYSRGLPDVGGSTICQNCCSEDGCNGLICKWHGTVMEKIANDTTITETDMNPTLASEVETTHRPTTFADCWDLRNRGGYDVNGIYDIYPPPAFSHVRVRCDMTTDGGGWTILQRRYDGSLNFTKTYQEYQDGFGVVTEEFWIGLEWIHVLTTRGQVQMRIDLCTFDGRAGYIAYNGFSIAFQSDRYRLHTGNYGGGNVEGWLYRHSGHVFSTTGECADIYQGGWWYRNSCYINANINGGKYNGGFAHGILWANHSDTSWLSLRSSEMKIRPVHVTEQTPSPYTCPT